VEFYLNQFTRDITKAEQDKQRQKQSRQLVFSLMASLKRINILSSLLSIESNNFLFISLL
jgi:hypothetical protein